MIRATTILFCSWTKLCYKEPGNSISPASQLRMSAAFSIN